MLIVKLIENSGFLLLALAAAGFLLLALRAFRNSRREARQEAREAAEKAETARRKAAAAVALAAEKKAAEEARREAAETAKAARTAAAEEVRKARQEAREAREAAAAEKLAEKLNAARLLAEYRERALAAARELQALEPPPRSSAPVLRPADPAQASAEPSADPDPATAPDNTPKPFAGHMVSFTGKMKSMTRPQAAEMVRQAGGRAFTKSMPVGTTLLVVGDTAGNDTRKLEKADEWIGQLRKITESQFLAMFNPS